MTTQVFSYEGYSAKTDDEIEVMVDDNNDGPENLEFSEIKTIKAKPKPKPKPSLKQQRKVALPNGKNHNKASQTKPLIKTKKVVSKTKQVEPTLKSNKIAGKETWWNYAKKQYHKAKDYSLRVWKNYFPAK